MVQGRL